MFSNNHISTTLLPLVQNIEGMAKTVKEEKTRTSLILYSDTFKSVKYIGLMDEKDISEIVNEALIEYVGKWEKKHGLIPKK